MLEHRGAQHHYWGKRTRKKEEESGGGGVFKTPKSLRENQRKGPALDRRRLRNLGEESGRGASQGDEDKKAK